MRSIDGLRWSALWHAKRLPARAVERGLPAGLLGNRYLPHENLAAHAARDPSTRIETVHPRRIFENPLPRNVVRREDLSRDGALWGYSMHDVPQRSSDPTLIATLQDCRLAFFVAEPKHRFHPAIVTRDGRDLRLREIRWRPGHRAALGRGRPLRRIERATWILERVYDNHSHWLTAHLPKLVLLRERGLLGDVVLPLRLSPVMDASLRALGIDPGACTRFDPAEPLAVDALTIVSTDRFRPELLGPVRDALAPARAEPPRRRVFVSRKASRGRNLVNEDALHPMLRRAGFEILRMEDLSFEEQVALMRETAILVAPHGAGLTNMIFCPPGSEIVEIADPGFPNPNFYALACAMDLGYALVHGQTRGEAAHPLDRDLFVDPGALERALEPLVEQPR